jgi:hypothetical protein
VIRFCICCFARATPAMWHMPSSLLCSQFQLVMFAGKPATCWLEVVMATSVCIMQAASYSNGTSVGWDSTRYIFL